MEHLKLKITTIYAFYKQIPYVILSIILFFLAFIVSGMVGIDLRFVFFILIFICISKAFYGFFYYILMDIRLYDDRMIFKEGVFSKKTNFLELYRVIDYNIYQSFFMRIFGIQNIILITSDKLNPIVKIKGLKNNNIVENIRLKVEIQRKAKGVRYFE